MVFKVHPSGAPSRLRLPRRPPATKAQTHVSDRRVATANVSKHIMQQKGQGIVTTKRQACWLTSTAGLAPLLPPLSINWLKPSKVRSPLKSTTYGGKGK